MSVTSLEFDVNSFFFEMVSLTIPPAYSTVSSGGGEALSDYNSVDAVILHLNYVSEQETLELKCLNAVLQYFTC